MLCLWVQACLVACGRPCLALPRVGMRVVVAGPGLGMLDNAGACAVCVAGRTSCKIVCEAGGKLAVSLPRWVGGASWAKALVVCRARDMLGVHVSRRSEPGI